MNKEQRKIQAVVFDMAGTTIDEGNLVYQSVQHAMKLFGFAFTLDKIMVEIGGMSKREGIEQLLKANFPNRCNKLLVDKIFDAFRNGLEERYISDTSIKEMAGASDLFRWLRSKNIRIALNTGYFRSTVDILIERMGWATENLIDFSVASDEVEKGRPEPNMLNKISSEFQVAPTHIAKVGDTISDINEGHNAGCAMVIGITSTKYSQEDLRQLGATHTISRLVELKELF